MPEPQRFRNLTRTARRNRDASRAAVAILKADSRVAQTLERALLSADLTLPQFNVLMELASTEDGSLPLYELNARLISTPANMSWLSTRMADTGLVSKRRADYDTRVVLLTITEAGWRALDRAAPAVFAAERQLLGAYTRDELRLLSALLRPLIEAESPGPTRPSAT